MTRVEWLLIAIAVGGVGLWTMLRLRPRLPAIPDTPEALLAAAASESDDMGAVFGEASGVRFPGPAARRWAYGVLYEAGVDADADPSYAAGILMRAQPKLTRAQADALVRLML